MTLEVCILQIGLWVKRDLFVLGLDEMENDMTTILVLSLAITKPLSTVVMKALDNSLHVMDTTVSARMWWQGCKVIWL